MRIALASHGEQQAGARTFRSPVAVVVWWAWLAFAVANLIDLAVQGRDRTSAVAAAILVLITGVVYVTALRPRLVTDDVGLTVVNPLRDHRIAMACVAKVDVAELLRVHCDWSGGPGGYGGAGSPPVSGGFRRVAPPGKQRKVVCAWGIHYSRRRAFTADARARRAAVRGSVPGLPGLTGYRYAATPPPTAQSEAQNIASMLNDLAATARHDAARAADAAAIDPDGVGPVAAAPPPPRATWRLTAIAALVIPVLILVVVLLALDHGA